ncbi:hypothetical protein BDK88_4088 [Natrinema hispanicum]|uniref:Uncharacterized protein n=1 Tax=Natrinema hispanicum TaxID=392421 RepID=A0A482Y588_9EURY|nr:hypothetical protein BDK88_4088 [Natrinema hispanicum]
MKLYFHFQVTDRCLYFARVPKPPLASGRTLAIRLHIYQAVESVIITLTVTLDAHIVCNESAGLIHFSSLSDET